MADSERRANILLVAADWRSRALLLAELQEAGHSVVPLPSLEVALAALAAGRVCPAMVVLDVQGDPLADPRRIGQLLNFLEEDVPLLLIAGVYDVQALSSLRERVACWLSRPLRIGDVLAAVQRLLSSQGQDSQGDGGTQGG